MQIKSDPIPMETTTVNADSTNKSVIDSNLTDATIVTSTESNKDEKIPKDKNNEKKLPVNSENKLMDLENQPPTMTEVISKIVFPFDLGYFLIIYCQKKKI